MSVYYKKDEDTKILKNINLTNSCIKGKIQKLYKSIEGEEPKKWASQTIQIVQVILLKIQKLQWKSNQPARASSLLG